MKKSLLILLPAFLLAACEPKPAMEVETSKNGVQAELIAEVDGCRVWRIEPGGTSRTVYMARCPEGAAGTQHSVSCGKNCTTNQTTLGTRRALP